MLKHNKGIHVEAETEKAIPTQGKQLNTDSVGSPPLGKKVMKAQGPFLCGQEGGRKAAHDTAFPSSISPGKQ